MTHFDGAAINLRPLALAHRLVALALIVTGPVRITGIFSGSPGWSSLLFYTVLSNVLSEIYGPVLVHRQPHPHHHPVSAHR